MNNFWVRTISGIFIVGIISTANCFGSIFQWIFCAVIGSLGIWEFLKLKNTATKLSVFFGLILHLLIISITKNNIIISNFADFNIAFAEIIGVILLMYFVFLLKYNLQAFERINSIIFAIIYVSVPFYLLIQLNQNLTVYDWRKPMLVFILVWISDTCAYLVGRAIGKKPLFEILSPKKTREGFIGGAILTGISACILAYIWPDFLSYLDAIILGILVSVFGTAGDLFQSSLKRNAGVKDSGKIIPGHGGILDRFDAFLFAVIAVWCYFVLTGII